MLDQADMSLQQAGVIMANAGHEWCRPSAVYRPRLFLDGNKYCALYGEDLMSGCAGFGDTAAQAMADFDQNWHQSRAPSNKPPKGLSDG